MSCSAVASGQTKSDVAPKQSAEPARVAVLNFGACREQHSPIGDMLGVQIDVDSWREAVRLLEVDRTQVLIVQVRSGGGSLLAMQSFQEFFQKECKPRFRTVAWIDSAVRSACLAILPIEEVCFRPDGTLGPGPELYQCMSLVPPEMMAENLIVSAETAARQGKHSTFVARAMLTQEPLSVDIADSGSIEWRQDELGFILLNTINKPFAFTATNAVRVKFASGIASSREEVVKAIGLSKVEWVGKAASDLLDTSMRDRDAEYISLKATLQKYELSILMADAAPVTERRITSQDEAALLLSSLEATCKKHPGMARAVGISGDWVEQERHVLARLQSRDSEAKSKTQRTPHIAPPTSTPPVLPPP